MTAPSLADNRRHPIITFEGIITDRGSKYAVSGMSATCKQDAVKAVNALRKKKKFAKATHNSWAVLLTTGGPVKQDDGEAGAGMVIIRMLERAQLFDHVIIVTRWFGGVHLGGDRFRHIQASVTHYLSHYQAPDQPANSR